MTSVIVSDSTRPVTGGVDTHKETHVGVVLDSVGARLGVHTFDADAAGYKALLGWMGGFGHVVRVGVEGTGSWGAGLARYLAGEGVVVVEVARPDRKMRRLNGKSDPVDAEAAALAALSGRASGIPKAANGPVESIRMLRAARASAVRDKTAVCNQFRSVLDTAPEPVRSDYRTLTVNNQLTKAAKCRPGLDLGDPVIAARVALKELAGRAQHLAAEIGRADDRLEALVAKTAPRLVAVFGVGTHTAATLLVCAGDNPHRLKSSASFAALCGVNPIPASSGKTRRHRLNRAGNRQANSALWRIAMTRLAYDDRTKTYMERRTTQGRSKPEIIRCLKRAIARELYPIIVADLAPNPDN